MRIHHSAVLGSRAHRPLRSQCLPPLVITVEGAGERPRHAGEGEEEQGQLHALHVGGSIHGLGSRAERAAIGVCDLDFCVPPGKKF